MIDNIVCAALIKALESEKVAILPGRYEINETVQIKIVGTVAKSADTMAKPTCSIPWKLVSALLLEKMGVTRDAASKMIVDAYHESLAIASAGDDKTVEAALEEKLKNIAEAEKRINAIVSALPKKPKAGPTNIEIREVSFMVVADAPQVSEETLPEAALSDPLYRMVS